MVEYPTISESEMLRRQNYHLKEQNDMLRKQLQDASIYIEELLNKVKTIESE